MAELKDKGRRYWLRVGDRVRMMSREEIAAKFAGKSQESQGIEKQLLADRERVQSKKDPCFWLKVVPDPELDIQSFGEEEKAFLTNPATTGPTDVDSDSSHSSTGPLVTRRAMSPRSSIERQAC